MRGNSRHRLTASLERRQDLRDRRPQLWDGVVREGRFGVDAADVEGLPQLVHGPLALARRVLLLQVVEHLRPGTDVALDLKKITKKLI